jgi:hypothetical protein
MTSVGVVLLPNVLLTTARGAYNQTTHATATPTPHLVKVVAHIERARASSYVVLAAAALDADYVATVAPGTDIAVGDRVIAITLLDGVTPWPSSQTVAAHEVWTVVFVREMGSLLLLRRLVYLARQIGGGVAQ